MMFLFIFILLLAVLIIVVYNYDTAPVFRAIENDSANFPLVTVLIPARNEEENISRSLQALCHQDYKPIEILVGNDNSTDNTGSIISEYSLKNPFIRRIDLPEPGAGWKGKNFAAHALSESAGGEMLLFIDADVVLNTRAISSAVKYMRDYKADLLSVFPGQLNISWGEKLIVPLLNFFLLSLLPLRQVYDSKHPSLAAGIGQFMMFRKSAYNKIGGHAHLKDEVVEDVAFIKLAKKMGFKVLAMLDQGLIVCRMYNGLNDAVNGFTKNFFKGTRLPVSAYLVFITVYFLIFFIPFIMVLFNTYYILPVLMILVIRWLISIKSGQSIVNIILHPFQMIFFYFIGIRSWLYGDKVKWKGRTV